MTTKIKFDTDLTPSHIITDSVSISELEKIADEIESNYSINHLNVQNPESKNPKDNLRRKIFKVYSNSRFNEEEKKGNYLPPYNHFSLGQVLLENEPHPLDIFEELNLIDKKTIFHYKLIMGQLIESSCRMFAKGSLILSNKTNLADLYDPVDNTKDAKKQYRLMRRSEKGKEMLREVDYHSILTFMNNDTTYAKLNEMWNTFREFEITKSEKSYQAFKKEHQMNLNNFENCLKYAHIMTQQFINIVCGEESYKRISGTVDMVLYPEKYKKKILEGQEHLKYLQNHLSSMFD